jgi:peroxiredoxin
MGMKKLILITLAALPALAFSQDNKYAVEGTFGAYNKPAKVYLQHMVNEKKVIDSVILNNGKFEFKGSLEGNDPTFAYLLFNKTGGGPSYKDYKTLFLEKGTITVIGDTLMANAKVSGTKTNDDNARYNAALKPVNDAYDALEAKKKGATPEQQTSEAFAKENFKAEKAIELQETGTNKQFIKDNPDSYISLMALDNIAYNSDYSDIAPLWDGLSPALKASKGGKSFAERLPKMKAIAIGASAPEFAQADTAGKTVNLSSFRGKYVLIDFWASWCGPCRRENPNLVKAYNRFKGQSFTVLGVSLDKPGAKDKWLAAIHKDGLTWNHVSDLKFWDNQVAVQYAIRGIPQNFLIDPQGKIVAKNLFGDDLEDKLEELFGKI